MHFIADVLGFEVFGEVLGQHVPAIRRCVDQNVARRACNRAVQHHLERLVSGFAGVERQVVAEDDEALWAHFDQLGDVRKIDQIHLLHFNQTQSLGGVFAQHRFHERRLAGAARTGQQHVIGGETCYELTRVLIDRSFLLVDRDEIGERDRLRMRH